MQCIASNKCFLFEFSTKILYSEQQINYRNWIFLNLLHNNVMCNYYVVFCFRNSMAGCQLSGVHWFYYIIEYQSDTYLTFKCVWLPLSVWNRLLHLKGSVDWLLTIIMYERSPPNMKKKLLTIHRKTERQYVSRKEKI